MEVLEENLKVMQELRDPEDPLLFEARFLITEPDGIVVLKTKVVNRWLAFEGGVPSNVVGHIPCCTAKIIGCSWKSWEPMKKYGEFQIYDHERLVYTAAASKSHRGGVAFKVSPHVVGPDSVLSCFFKGSAYNPEVALLFEEVKEE